uniref:Uncharacterized protein n=1 Tax=Candidatus Kentrum sp. LFY TaxID=2126342 RepID=A0A450V4H3_9GAMM|nr:MAG: hypothetical protein BECKLFY1418A_GA0070994_110313 [Candidatus Kentron sp. LFY]
MIRAPCGVIPARLRLGPFICLFPARLYEWIEFQECFTNTKSCFIGLRRSLARAWFGIARPRPQPIWSPSLGSWAPAFPAGMTGWVVSGDCVGIQHFRHSGRECRDPCQGWQKLPVNSREITIAETLRPTTNIRAVIQPELLSEKLDRFARGFTGQGLIRHF